MWPNLPCASAKHTLVTYNIMLSLITKTTRGLDAFKPKIATCARKVMSLPSASTKDIWVPRSLLTNLNEPIKRWGPKYAWQALQGKGDDMNLWWCLSGLTQFLLTQAINLTMFYISKFDPKLFWFIISKTHIISSKIMML
jgi:hypothetical protein